MKANELKELLEKCDQIKTRKIISLIYKKVPKKYRDDLDDEIVALVNNETINKAAKEEDFASLVKDAEVFIRNANHGLYYMPNRIISKKERSQWRFKVMRYVKAIKKIDICDDNYDEANKLMLKLFEILSYACGYYTFSTFDTFSAIGTSQYEFFVLLASRLLKRCKDDETLTTLIKLATTSILDRMNLHEDMINALIGLMKNKEELLHLKELAKEIFLNGGFSVDEQYNSYRDFYKKEADNKLLLLIYCTSLELKDPLSEIDFYMENHKETDEEIGLYIILNSIDYDDCDKDWVDVYDYVTKKYKIDARDSLKQEYITKKNKISK